MKDIDSVFLRLVLAALLTLLVLVLGHSLLGCSEATATTASMPASVLRVHANRRRSRRALG